ncbi:MAG: transcription termination factor Rho [Lachnospiraceae bacterium]|nr:transcription termination factor Rho [Lachnospiraceae bacterium]
MREKLETLPLTELKALAKQLNIKRTTGIRKADLIESILRASEEQEKAAASAPAGPAAAEPAPEAASEAPAAADEAETAGQDTAEKESAGAPAEPRRRRNERRGAGKQEGGERQNGRRNARGNDARRSARGENRGNEKRGNENRANENRGNENRGESRPNDDTEAAQEKRQPKNPEQAVLDAGEPAEGILEIMPDGYGFLRGENFLSGEGDIYVSQTQIRRFGMRTGDMVSGIKKLRGRNDKFAALLYVNTINGHPADSVKGRPHFEDLTPIFPDKRIHLETPGCEMSMRIVDLMSPIGKGQRGMIVSPPKAGKTTLLKQIAKAVQRNYPEMNMIVLLIDERPEEVTDFKESIHGERVQVIYSTFDELPEHHKRVTEMVLERAKRLVETGEDVIILLDSITRLSRAYNLTVTPSGRTLSGGLDPAALYMPKKFFGAARNLREGGSLTILATALVDTGSRLDEMVFEEFKGTGNMELALDRRLSERRIFPAIDILKSGTRRDDLLLSKQEQHAMEKLRRLTAGLKQDDATDQTLNFFMQSRSNAEVLARLERVML